MGFVLRRVPALVALGLALLAAVAFLVGAVGAGATLALAGVLVALLGLGTSGRRDVRPRTPVAVPPEEAEQEEGEVWACLRCGSTDVGSGSALQGQIPGAGDAFAWMCRRCGHRGAPLRFDDATAYREFVKGLNEPR